MLSRDQVFELYRLLLDREPESEAVVNEKRNAETAIHVAADMLNSDEFFTRNKSQFKTYVNAAPQAELN